MHGDGSSARYVAIMETVFDLPSHPLFVHVPVVLVPLAFVGVVGMVVRPRWWDRLIWPTFVVAVLGTVGAVLAAGSGEELEEAVEGRAVRALVHDHAEAGELARTASLLFFVVLVATFFGPRVVTRLRSARWWRPIMMVAVLVSGGVASWSMFDAGHSGAKSVWNDVHDDGDHDDGDHDGEDHDD
ncbi:MAG: hypothetical protein RIS41_2086 [Actinomycetota bacterium]|jgi:hypothetical protein